MPRETHYSSGCKWVGFGLENRARTQPKIHAGSDHTNVCPNRVGSGFLGSEAARVDPEPDGSTRQNPTHLHPELRPGDPLSVEAQVAVGLYRLGHGSTYVTIGHIFNIGKETADNASARFVTAVLAKFRIKAISFLHLNNTSQWAEIEGSFENKHGIPGIVGAIDGTHVPLRKPPNARWKSYINRKSWASIVFQCVVDGEGNFRNVHLTTIPRSNISSALARKIWAVIVLMGGICISPQVSGGGPGSMHDGRLFRCSALGHNLSQRGDAVGTPVIPRGKYLIGDAGYPANVRVLVPYPSVANPANEDFNFIHSLTRMIVEQAFGWLKNQFRILLHAQLARPIRAHNNTFACMVLHNMLNKRGTMYLQVWDNRSPDKARFAELHNTSDDDLTPQTPNGGQPTMASIRDQLRTQLCT
ncbi:hypothetical protein PSHT_11133 [Puccinia striiformis]|uniref:DDE Tnp4 domain-containing protein n=1 Tax=Puccinia striiformis TaxID=27350 RepID=A0A2S4V5G1_9BASI|nr:hypothetical protein PSHT_11133 [Puccinia striiformis]